MVGSQVASGQYRSTTAVGGCYWERLRGFSGTISDVIANDFVPSAGPLVIAISSNDAGFHTDGDCGTWQATGVPSGMSPMGTLGTGDTESAWRAHRARLPLRRSR